MLLVFDVELHQGCADFRVFLEVWGVKWSDGDRLFQSGFAL